MKAFGEYITNPVLITRFGMNTTHRRAKYWKSVTGEIIQADKIVLKGYDQTIHPEDFTEVMIYLYNEGFRICEIERIGPPHRTLICILGPRGVESMTVEKKNLPHPDEHKNEDGSHDQAKVAETIRMIADQIDAGHYRVDNLELSDWNEEGVRVGSFSIAHVDKSA